MFIENCPKEIHIQYPFIWDWYSDLDYSKDIKINLRKMKFLQAFVYKVFKIDADRCFNEKNKPKKKKDND